MLPEPTLYRLPSYLAYVNILKSQGVEYVSSTQISKAINIDASQIAKDLSFLNLRGKTRIGYEVELLAKELADFLGFKRRHNAVIMGVGSLGSALLQDSGLSQYGLNIVAGFDINPAITSKSVGGVNVYHVDELAGLKDALDVNIGILAVPVAKAQEAADMLVDNGFGAIWNFTPWNITAPDNVVIQNTSIYAHLAVMYNRIGANK
ncbi:MAG: redox-sensing transcriptional repressor Rex [Muribaculaceae bacterium]|nr:redox-sensing transcriptional repressor Rex [Muribaculaceae bacterium]